MVDSPLREDTMTINDRYLLTAGTALGSLITIGLYHWMGEAAEAACIAITSAAALYTAHLSDHCESPEED